MTKVISTKNCFCGLLGFIWGENATKGGATGDKGRGRKEKQRGDEMCFFLVDIEHRERWVWKEIWNHRHYYLTSNFALCGTARPRVCDVLVFLLLVCYVAIISFCLCAASVRIMLAKVAKVTNNLAGNLGEVTVHPSFKYRLWSQMLTVCVRNTCMGHTVGTKQPSSA